MKRIFKTRHFSRWMRKTELSDPALCAAVLEMERGLIDADLLKLASKDLDAHVEWGELQEICHDDQE